MLHQSGEALAPVMAAAAIEAQHATMLGNLQAVAVEFGFMQPTVTGRYALGRYWAAGWDETELGHSR